MPSWNRLLGDETVGLSWNVFVLLPSPLIEGRLIRRYKRFLADIELADGSQATAHCPNTGSMMGCAEPGSRVWLSRSANPRRKYPLTWELVEVDRDRLVGINTARSNALVRESIEDGTITELTGYGTLKAEVRFGVEGSRVDLFLAGGHRRRHCFVEVKNVTAAVAHGIALFPDAVTERGNRHLRELMGVVAGGQRGVLCFSVQREDAREVRPADEIDPDYGRTLRHALEAGVEVIAYRAQMGLEAIRLRDRIPVVCP